MSGDCGGKAKGRWSDGCMGSSKDSVTNADGMVAGAVASGQHRSWDEWTSKPIGWLFSCVDSPKRDAQSDFDNTIAVVVE